MARMGLNGVLLAGRYRLDERVGSGGMAEVYRAEDLVLSRPVAVKLLHVSASAGDASAQERMRAEVRLHAQLSHPGLVTVYDAGEQDDRLFLVMQLVGGGSLADRLTPGPLSFAETTRIGAELADALAYLHDQGLVHRDLKPSNVLLDASGRVLLTDLGIARLVDAPRLTATNTTVGTAAYMAPEQARGGPVGPPADVYALGLLLIEALTGRPAYGGSNSFQVAIARLHHPPAIPDHAGRMRGLLAAMTAIDPDQRPIARDAAERLRDPQQPDRTAVLELPTEAVLPPWEAPRGGAPPHREAPVDKAHRLWHSRDARTVLGLRADVAIGLAMVTLLAVVLILTALPDGRHGTTTDRTGRDDRPAAPPGAKRLPADLNRLDRTVTP